LQTVAECCSVLQRVAACCNMLQRVAVCTCLPVLGALQRVAVCCSMLQCAAVCCNALQCDAVYCNVYLFATLGKPTILGNGEVQMSPVILTRGHAADNR